MKRFYLRWMNDNGKFDFHNLIHGDKRPATLEEAKTFQFPYNKWNGLKGSPAWFAIELPEEVNHKDDWCIMHRLCFAATKTDCEKMIAELAGKPFTRLREWFEE
jgi:hypothetical protein